MKKDYIRYVGYSKRHGKEITVISCPETERDAIRTMYHVFEPDTMIEVREYKSGVLIEEIKLEDLFNLQENDRAYKSILKRTDH
jgi:hypothetical protein